MKEKKPVKPKYRNSVLMFCYLTGIFDRWFRRNKGDTEDATFIAKRIAAFTEYTATMIKVLLESTEESRNKAQNIMSSLDDHKVPTGKTMGQKRERRILKEEKADLIRLDGSIRKETVKVKESLLPYIDKLKAETIAYAHGFSKKTVADSMLESLYSIEHNSAYIAYQHANALIDSAIHERAKAVSGIKDKEDEHNA